jgi:hypothetical protein
MVHVKVILPFYHSFYLDYCAPGFWLCLHLQLAIFSFAGAQSLGIAFEELIMAFGPSSYAKGNVNLPVVVSCMCKGCCRCALQGLISQAMQPRQCCHVPSVCCEIWPVRVAAAGCSSLLWFCSKRLSSSGC